MQALVRKIGNSSGTIIPASLLKKLNLKEGDQLDIRDEDGRIVMTPNRQKTRYTLTELLAKCDESASLPQELIDWENSPEVGGEKW